MIVSQTPRRALLTVTLVGCLLAFSLVTGCALTPSPTAATANPSREHLLTRSTDGMPTIGVPAGSFVMGSTDAEVDRALELCDEAYGQCRRAWFQDEQPAHEVTLDAFRIDQTEVTNAQFAAFLNAQSTRAEGGLTWAGVLLDLESEHCLIQQGGDRFRPQEGYAEHPAIMVSWYGAKAYCEWVGARLPTEAEWEYAARGPDRPLYPWGDTFDGARLNYCDVNCIFDSWKDSAYDDGYAGTAPVGSYPDGASWCGALDMAGNAWEWMADRYSDDYYTRSPANNPRGPDTGQFRVQRGGSWTASLRDARSARRHRYPASWQDHAVSFRCASTVHQDLADAEVPPVISVASAP